MFAVIGEDKSDVEVIARIIRRLTKDQSITIKGKGFNGCGELLKRGANQLQAYREMNFQRFIACYDSDGGDPEIKKRELIDRVFKPANILKDCCAVVPVHMIESWILADLEAAARVITGWTSPKAAHNPEAHRDPKKSIVDLSARNHRPRYNHATHNPQIARYLDLDVVYAKCPSFRPLHAFVTRGTCNVMQ